MLKYMTLIRGNAEITYPIYQIGDLSKLALAVAGVSSDYIKFVAYRGNPTETPGGIQPVFEDEIPTTPVEYGNITQNSMRFVLDTATRKQYCPSAHFVVVPVGEKPTDWDTNYFDYFTYQTGQVGNWGNVPLAIGPATNPREIPIWESTTQYYKADTATLQERFNHLFFTKAGYSFGVWSMSGQGEGDAAYCHASYIACNPRNNAIMDDSNAYIWREQNGDPMTHSVLNYAQYYAYWRTNCMDMAPPVSGAQVVTTPLTSDRRDIQIFCYGEYNGEMYYGVMAIAIDSNGELTNARALMFTADFWGDSITDDTPEQGGNWGGNNDRAGGDGTFSAPSDNDGDRNGTSLLSAISTANATFKTVLGGNYNLYYVPPADLTKILGVLYSSDYFQRFENSMYNPLSAVLNCALIPEIFCRYSAGVTDMTAGGYNISQHIFPNAVQFANPEPLIMQHIGDIDIPKYFGAYPDFAPYTQCKLHLPYIGEIEIDMNKIADGTLAVDYVCDVMSGNVTAWIWCKDRDENYTYCYNATGNCAYSIPLFANSSDGSAIGKIIGGIASIAAGNVFSGVASTASGAASAISRHTQVSGTFSGNIGLTTNPKCFAEFSRPQWVNPANYQNQSGIPSEISGKLSDFRGGFVQVETIDLENVPATESELAEIESLLESGIYYVSN
jgi:hypothetical protein